MLVHRRARRLGVGAAVLAAAERAAREAGKTLLVLDTASAEAERLYERGGWQRVGTIPNYALMPDGAALQHRVLLQRARPIDGSARAATSSRDSERERRHETSGFPCSPGRGLRVRVPAGVHARRLRGGGHARRSRHQRSRDPEALRHARAGARPQPPVPGESAARVRRAAAEALQGSAARARSPNAGR